MSCDQLLYHHTVNMLCFFFFKQKTAYEMRISDWSSDVCSSDLYDVPSKRTRKLTEGLPPFWDTYRERNVRNGMDYYTVKLAGWSKDGRYVVMSDHFALLAFPRRPDDAAMPIRLTPDGRERRISYTLLDLEGKVRWFRNLRKPATEDPPCWIDRARALDTPCMAQTP